MDASHPFREGPTGGACPRCHELLASDGGDGARMVCAAGCGEWYAAGTLIAPEQVLVARLDDTTGWPWGAAACPVCRRDMQIRVRAEVRFDHCSFHGIWLDAGEYPRFVEAFRRA
ncbi:MAG TPA: zf-TFIIB domain-containing protein [Kofleriaceae bacterium]